MKRQSIKEILPDPRQLTFGFDDNSQEKQNFVISCITEQFEEHGKVT